VFFDAVNAELLASATTDSSGHYDSGNLPTGDYRVRLSDAFSTEFVGAGGLNTFCAGTIVPVLALTTSALDAQILGSKSDDGPKEIADLGGGIAGTVVDASTGAPLQGIRVSILDASSAELIATVSTDADGFYSFGSKDGFLPAMKARFADPGGSFFPEFYGADADAFCTAATVLPKSPGTADASLDRVPPAHLTQHLAETVQGYDLPTSVATMLGTSLTQVRALLADDNAGNDAAACGQLGSFVTRVDVQERRGALSTAQASELRSLVASLRTAIGCH